MSLRRYIVFMIICTALCWLGFSLVVYNINPFQAGVLGFVFFYISLFCSLVGTFALLGYWARRLVLKYELVLKHVNLALRQGLLLACMVIGFLFLQSQAILTGLNASLLIIILTLFEFFFLTYKPKRKHRY